MNAVVADCDLLNFTLVHLKLGAEVQKLLKDCGRSIITFDRVYRREAQAPLREAIDVLEAAKLCVRVDHPEDRKLEKRQQKVLQQVYRVAEKQYRTTSTNDRGLLAEAQIRDAPLFTEDGPLRGLAAERGQPTFDARDVVTLLFELHRIDAARRDTLLGQIETRARQRQRPEARAAEGRGVAALLCSPPDHDADDPQGEPPAEEARLTPPPAPSPAPADPSASN